MSGRFLVTVNFTRNSVPETAIMSVPAAQVANATAALNLAVAAATSLLDQKAALVGDTIVIGTTSVVAA